MRSAAAAAAGLWLAAGAVVGLGPGSSQAIIVDGETPENTERPADDPGWDNFCHVIGEGTNLGSAVYIGQRSQLYPNGILLSARHLFPASGPGAIEFRCTNGAEFRVKRGPLRQSYEPLCVWRPGGLYGERGQKPACRLPEAGNLARITDVVLMEPDRDPGLPDLELATAEPPDGTPMLMIGEGNKAGPIVTPCVSSGVVRTSSGYRSAFSDDVPRWGLNRVVFGSYAVFDPDAGDAIPATGDSGGPAFVRDASSGRWKLLGLAYSSIAGSPEQQACIRDPEAPGIGPGAGWSALYNAKRQLASRRWDSDGDGISDFADNCPSVPNPDQWNANHLAIDAVPAGDRFEYAWLHTPIPDYVYGAQEDGATPPVAGNRCDADFDEDGSVSLADLVTFKACVLRRGTQRGPAADPTCAESDMDGSGRVTVGDLRLLRNVFGRNGQGM